MLALFFSRYWEAGIIEIVRKCHGQTCEISQSRNIPAQKIHTEGQGSRLQMVCQSALSLSNPPTLSTCHLPRLHSRRGLDSKSNGDV